MYQSLKLAIKSIRSNLLRSALTMLGIIIGVAAVVTLISVVSGFTGEMIKQFEEIGLGRRESEIHSAVLQSGQRIISGYHRR